VAERRENIEELSKKKKTKSKRDSRPYQALLEAGTIIHADVYFSAKLQGTGTKNR